MELKDFVKETLSQVTEGIEAAQADVRACGGFVNPAHRVNSKSSSEAHFGVLTNGQNIFLVDFNVSVTVVEESGKTGNAKLQVASLLNVGGGAKSNRSNAATNTIGFKVPLGLPVDTVSENQLKEQDEKLREKQRKQSETIRNINRDHSNWSV